MHVTNKKNTTDKQKCNITRNARIKQTNKGQKHTKHIKKTSQELGNCPIGQREALLKEMSY